MSKRYLTQNIMCGTCVHGSRTLTTAVCHEITAHRIVGCCCNYCNREPGSYFTILAHFMQSQSCKKAAGDKSTAVNTHYFHAHRHAVKFPSSTFTSELLDLDSISNSTDTTGPIALYKKYLNPSVVDTHINGDKQLPDVPARYLRKSNPVV